MSVPMTPPASASRYDLEQVWLSASERLLDWDDTFHELLLGDRIRMRAFRAAIDEVVQPGMTVLDLGTGTGILARWALQNGAARVYGIELNEDILAAAVERLATAGYGASFKPIHGMSLDVSLPEPVDVIVSETLGNLADNEGTVEILDDARRRFLAPGGLMIPARVESYLVPVAAERAHTLVTTCTVADVDAGDWLSRVKKHGGRDQFDVYYDAVLPSSSHLAPARVARRYDLGRANDATYCETLTWTVHDAGPLTGFKGYFIATLSPTVALDISGDDPGSDARDTRDTRTSSDSWKHCYLPIANPVLVCRDDRIRLELTRAARPDRPFQQAYHWKGAVLRGRAAIATFGNRQHP
ncbi:MAG TPA: class I SAM-dependent methyltransferase [Solirubrobacteraceae bacterium]|nr:class I SAM-dependent methyltransferase [Solirubrobacteraceae bacterium]